MYNLKYYQNIETSKNTKTTEKEKNKMIVSRMIPPPNTNTIVVNKSNQVSDRPQPQRNPIRHYRRQLTGNNTANILINPQFDVPGSSIVKQSTPDCPKCDNSGVLFFGNEIYPNSNPSIDCSNIGYQSSDPNLWKYTSCLKANNVTKSANTNLSKKYFTSNRDYLKNRGKNFKDNLYKNNQYVNKQKISNSDCSYCTINTYNVIPPSTGNINNSIGGSSMSAYIYRRSFRDIAENSISNNSINNNDNLCCPKTPGKVLYKNNYNNCKVNDYPNLSRRAILYSRCR